MRAIPVTARSVACDSMLEQRRRSVEAERLRDAWRDDVDGDAGERERRPETDAERDHAHVLEARVGEQPLPRQRAPEKRDRNGERDEPEEDQDVLSRSRADDGRERVLGAPRDEQHRGEKRRGEQRRHRRRRLGVRVGEPVVHGRPADLRGEAREQEDVRDERALAAGRIGRERVPRERTDPTARNARGENDDAEQRDAEAERGEDEVLPAGLERARLAAETDEQRRRRGRRLDQEPRDAEIPRERHREENDPEREEQGEIRVLTALR